MVSGRCWNTAELQGLLRDCIETSEFSTGRTGETAITGEAVRTAYAWQWHDRPALETAAWSRRVRGEERTKSLLEEWLFCNLEELIDQKTRRLGNGLYWLCSGYTIPRFPTIPEYSDWLITGGAKLGYDNLAVEVQRWRNAEQERFVMRSVLKNAWVEEGTETVGPISVRRRPTTQDVEPGTLPRGVGTMHSWNNAWRTMLDVSYTSPEPGLFKPESNDVEAWLAQFKGREEIASGTYGNATMSSRILKTWPKKSRPICEAKSCNPVGVHDICEAISLACNDKVEPLITWLWHPTANAFSSSLTMFDEPRDMYRPAVVTPEVIANATELVESRSRQTTPQLEIALDRWLKSKKTHDLSGKLIELRIALEVVYNLGREGEKRFRTAHCVAWDLGRNFEERQKYAQDIRAAYDAASTVLHTGIPPKDFTREKVEHIESVCRDILTKRVRTGSWTMDTLLGPEYV